ncbi:hypothetical protein IEQ34_015762 [Dendrobium chrysotoxum]|uniref:Uncharacterized protein n=1 Tax=Dendrobium chrysotoxum TaxID=161865 RepID=A0AAV7G0Y2_DENCH|nr:hypothetical protein IEQ34_015762 [Dendrobium chrysotoxum]
MIAVTAGSKRGDEVGEDGSLGGGEVTVPYEVDGYGTGEEGAFVVSDSERLLFLRRCEATRGETGLEEK